MHRAQYQVLIVDTLAWAVPIALQALPRSYIQLVLSITGASISPGCILTVGYSLISDIDGPGRHALHWRGVHQRA